MPRLLHFNVKSQNKLAFLVHCHAIRQARQNRRLPIADCCPYLQRDIDQKNFSEITIQLHFQNNKNTLPVDALKGVFLEYLGQSITPSKQVLS